MACATQNKNWCIAGLSNNFFHFLVQVVILLACGMAWQVWVINTHKFRKAWPTFRIDQSSSDSRHYSINTIKWELGAKENNQRFVNFIFNRKNLWENLCTVASKQTTICFFLSLKQKIRLNNIKIFSNIVKVFVVQ